MFTTLNPPEIDEASERIEWAERIEQALHGRGVRTVFQPIIDLNDQRVCGYEALTRFDGPLTGKRIGPEQWFQAAHELGAGGELEAVCLASALRYRQSLPAGCYLSVNVDPDSLVSPRVQAVLDEQGSLQGVVVELTEHQVWTWTQIEDAVNKLRSRGARIAIDNTGTGSSGLRQLVDCRPSMLKIDRQLIDRIDQDEAKLALVEMMVVFSRRIGAELVAEGVETVAEALTLIELQVPQAQGYLFGRPEATWSEIQQDDIACLLRVGDASKQAPPAPPRAAEATGPAGGPRGPVPVPNPQSPPSRSQAGMQTQGRPHPGSPEARPEPFSARSGDTGTRSPAQPIMHSFQHRDPFSL